MKPFKNIKVISVIVVAVILAVGISLQFKTPRLILTYLVSVYPLSAIINKIQHYTIPDNNAACLATLKKRDVSFTPQSDFSNKKGCNVEFAIRLARVGSVKISKSPLLTCRMAMQLSIFEQKHLQLNAQSILGSKVSQLNHLGTYSCRGMRQFPRLLSQHAFANAIDVSEFVLADGRRISIAKDWQGSGNKSAFLRAIRNSACKTFRVSISPDGDANHWDHFHWDFGLMKSCR